MAKSKILNTNLFINLPLNKSDKIIFSIYIVLTAITFSFLLSNKNDTVEKWVLCYGYLTHLLFYLFLYVSLRNLKTFLIWIGISLFHLFLYFHFYRTSAPVASKFSLMPLRNTTILLVIFQLLRWTFLKIKKVNLVMPSRSGKDLFEERVPGFLDFLWLLFYMTVFFVLNLLPFLK